VDAVDACRFASHLVTGNARRQLHTLHSQFPILEIVLAYLAASVYQVWVVVNIISAPKKNADKGTGRSWRKTES
jgi:hypothetical protein